jgi:hypothetical protein
MEKQMRPRPNLKKLQQQVDEFNARVPVGSSVVRTDDSGGKHETITESTARVLSGHTAVVWVADTSGCVLLERIVKLS